MLLWRISQDVTSASAASREHFRGGQMLLGSHAVDGAYGRDYSDKQWFVFI